MYHRFEKGYEPDCSKVLKAGILKAKVCRAGFLSSFGASYTPEEIADLLVKTKLAGAHVRGLRIILAVSGTKSAIFAGSVRSS